LHRDPLSVDVVNDDLMSPEKIDDCPQDDTDGDTTNDEYYSKVLKQDSVSSNESLFMFKKLQKLMI